MADVLFHHSLGLTDGVRAFADHLRATDHAVSTPDLFVDPSLPSYDPDAADLVTSRVRAFLDELR